MRSSELRGLWGTEMEDELRGTKKVEKKGEKGFKGRVYSGNGGM